MSSMTFSTQRVIPLSGLPEEPSSGTVTVSSVTARPVRQHLDL